MIRKILLCSLSMLATTILSADSGMKVVVSIPPQKDIVEALCDAQVESLIGPGESPESWSPSPGTIVQIVTSDLYAPIGIPFETSLRQKLEEIAPNLRICTRSVPAQSEDFLDPHVWLDPEGAIKHAQAVAECLKSLPGMQSSQIDARLATYIEKLRASEEQADRILAPYRGQSFLVYHPAFGHFARRFKLEQLAVEKDGKAPSSRWMATLIARSKKLGIHTIFVQPSFASDAVHAIAHSLDAEILVLDPLAKDLPENILRIARQISKSFDHASLNGESRDE